MKRFLLLLLTVFVVSCEKQEIESSEFTFEHTLPTSINRIDLLVEGSWGAPVQKYLDFNSSFFSQIHYNEPNSAKSASDVVEMWFDGTYNKLNLTERVFSTSQDSLNGLTFDIKDNKLLANFWGEGENGSWFYPNVLVMFDLLTNDYNILYDARTTNDSTFYTNILFDLNNDNVLDVYLGGMGYMIIDDTPTITSTIEGPGPVFVFDINSDGVDDLIHYDSTHDSWVTYSGGYNMNKSFINSDYQFRNFVDDYKAFDYDNDGDLDLFILDALTDASNDGCEVCVGKISVLENNNGNLTDVTKTTFSNSEFPQLFGDNNILNYDYDNDGDDDIFFPDYYYHNGVLLNNNYWENDNGFFVKKERKDLEN